MASPPDVNEYNTDHHGDVVLEHLAEDQKLNTLLKSVIVQVKQYAEDQIKHIKQLTHIGIALSAEKNISRLLETIVDYARELSNADAGTLYILDEERTHLRFEIMQNDTMKTRMGGTSGVKITLPGVPLYKNGVPNHSNVSSYSALTGKIVNIPDVYKATGFDFTGPREYDASTGYRSKSMLVIPMKNHEGRIIGVLQLLNAKRPETGKVIEFSQDFVDLVASLASQAAVALTNTQLIQNLKDLFYSFIQSIAAAIDAKSAYTGGHINRVVDLTMMIAEKINKSNRRPFKDVYFTQDEIEELRLAAWMHDVGKITTPENVVDKQTKLQSIFDRTQLLETRYNLIAKLIENEYLKRKLKLSGKGKSSLLQAKQLDKECAEELRFLEEELEFLKACNQPDEFMDKDKIDRIYEIAEKTYFLAGNEQPFLTKDEVHNLCIKKGSLNDKERKIIEDHATMTLKILSELPFPKNLANVPEYASSHHEKLDGSGYPRGISGKDLPLQSRIMVIADIFEALTAKDRPYKKPMKLSQALNIMNTLKEKNHIDPDIFELFLNSSLFYTYAKKEMAPEQIDEVARGRRKSAQKPRS